MNKPSQNKVAIIGAGASGLICATYLRQKNIDVTIFDKNSKIGRKLLATGNGRCNVTNTSIKLHNFYSHGEISLIKPILHNFDFHKCEKFFNSLGVLFTSNEQGRVYPLSQSASSIADAFEFELEKTHTKIKLEQTIQNVDFDQKNQQFILNGSYSFDYLIIATGSIAMQKLGASQSGYEIAQKFGHTIFEPFPSLVQLKSDNHHLEIIKGVKITAKVNEHTGDVLFTKYGISGSTILDISRDIAKQLQNNRTVDIFLDILPSFSKEKLLKILKERQKNLKLQKTIDWLDGIIHKKLSKFIAIELGLDKTAPKVCDLNYKHLQAIVHMMKNMKFTITDTNGFENCEVCAGGIAISEIDLKTMESKKQSKLYFIGEVLDIDGDCGGFNLHFAWASGYCAAQSLIKKLTS